MRRDTHLVKVHHTTAFQQRVYDAVCQIPAGHVATYGAVARAIGCGSSRAVGQALRRNTHGDEVPAHRVVASDLTLGGFTGEDGDLALRRKHRLLQREGVTFDENDRITSAVFAFPVQLATPAKRNPRKH